MADAQIEQFMAIASCDREFAASFLAANGGSLEAAVNNFMDPGMGAGMGGMGGMPPMVPQQGGLGEDPSAQGGVAFDALGGAFEEEPRAAIAQYTDKLVDADPARRAAPPQRAAQGHALEAFRDFKPQGDGGETSEGGGASEPREVFGLPKRARSLAEIYAAPTELCFSGSFDELRNAGRQQSKWLLINIQSPTEFASQQLNADTWRDETLRAVISASFLFWQQYARLHTAFTHASQHLYASHAACTL